MCEPTNVVYGRIRWAQPRRAVFEIRGDLIRFFDDAEDVIKEMPIKKLRQALEDQESYLAGLARPR